MDQSVIFKISLIHVVHLCSSNKLTNLFKNGFVVFFEFGNNIEFNLIYLLKTALCSLTATTKDEQK